MNGKQTSLEVFIQVLKESGEETLRARIQDQIKTLNPLELAWIILQIDSIKIIREEFHKRIR